MISLSASSRSAASETIEQVIQPRIFERVKGFKLRRVLSNAPTVGPFVLFDHFGPVTFGIGQGLDAGPHPHVSMTTLTCLFDGMRSPVGTTSGTLGVHAELAASAPDATSRSACPNIS